MVNIIPDKHQCVSTFIGTMLAADTERYEIQRDIKRPQERHKEHYNI